MRKLKARDKKVIDDHIFGRILFKKMCEKLGTDSNGGYRMIARKHIEEVREEHYKD